ncbi:alkylation response protein AidB-like acyl-CoA dehydrogenase [Streptosporangium becharense]|uniref:Alkylation response protein AidB-like acyl-CoA dehydrogenase n=1 Tax=Streptosporangium becharense TaxID=1816182 RepID=A0A7W9IBU8_9ACTN|nr:acyl-CoA dehydrogenase family protein [Streptosporangium becharense]MBB2910691.1 alkylation response protein AidB-like acyl-CoA dehydrogenase [Streptosporangium becharense]MBB5817386.1 alkylation response protein AidB-like acyl-CoA dehydrogenase [Streptosporangium becharense]
MNLDLGERERVFRQEARAWLSEHVPRTPLPNMDTPRGFAAHREWEATLAADRWSVVSWPREYLGRGASLLEWVLFEEEYYRAGGPARVAQNGISLLAPIIFGYGTVEQRERYLRPMADGAEIWAQAWSEPEAGSDLAALRSTAVRDDTRGGWVLNGQKTWSSRAAFAHRGFGLFRSDPSAGRHRGLTYFLFPLDADGVTVRPIRKLDGHPGFAEIFFTDVFVPDADVLGEPGDGWRVAMSTAGDERGLSLRSPGRFRAAADRLVGLWRERGGGAPALGERVADAWIAAQAYRLYTFATVTRLAAGGDVGAEGSVNKIFWSELDVHLHETALDLLGPEAELHGDWMDGYLFALAGPIYAGTNEIQRNIVAERLLGLPRGNR